MRAKEIAERASVGIDTLRFYEKRGLITEEHFVRSSSGYRDYHENVLERLQLIKGAQAAGFTINEIALLFMRWNNNELTDEEVLAQLQRKAVQIAGKINALEQVQNYLQQKICSIIYKTQAMNPDRERSS